MGAADQSANKDQGSDWPYVLKPRWIHDLLQLWRRKEPYELYLDHVAEYSVRERRDKVARRCCIGWLATHFAPSRAAATLNQNVWASYSNHFPCSDLAPAYLAHLISCEPLARQTTAALHGQAAPGVAIHRSQLSKIQAVPGAQEALLRTLMQWEVLAADPRKGGYIVEKRLNVPVQSFPLLVWAWWLETRQASVTQAEFAQLPRWTWFESEGFAAGWQRYAGQLWNIEKEKAKASGESTIVLLASDAAAFARSLLNLLSADGRRGRQLPRHGDPQPNEPRPEEARRSENGEVRRGASPLREGILGR